MSKSVMAGIGVLAVGFLFAAITLGMYFSYNREEVGARNACQAQLGQIENVLDNMWKNFQEIGGIPDRERATASKLFREYAEARTTEGEGHMMAWIKEQNPQITASLYSDLQARLTAGRQEYRESQKYMLDLVRTHTNIVQDPFKHIFLKNTEPFKFTVISSEGTKEAVRTSRDERTFTLPSSDK